MLSNAGLDDVARWYQRETGQEPDSRAASRLLKIAAYLHANGKNLEDVRLVPNQDRAWNTRRNRSEIERLATCIGNTGEAKRLTYWWILPRETPKKKTRKRKGKSDG